jgi:hypothetical protein
MEAQQKGVTTMPSGWMPDARHDRRTAFLFDPRRIEQREASHVRAGRRTHSRRTTHRTVRRPHAIARG